MVTIAKCIQRGTRAGDSFGHLLLHDKVAKTCHLTVVTRSVTRGVEVGRGLGAPLKLADARKRPF